ncbi:DUF427 domain-containing protein [Mesorhizobium sp. 2RAF45]|uniref:DUF427 domain-containing protein n=1 Tax=Mesorhizobium sp. 2RAF45 TaxID=3233001 RepID=UPI003F9EA99C
MGRNLIPPAFHFGGSQSWNAVRPSIPYWENSDAIFRRHRRGQHRAKVLGEEGREPVFYIPSEDIYFDLLERTNTTMESPAKGNASYWRVHSVGSSADDFMWTVIGWK